MSPRRTSPRLSARALAALAERWPSPTPGRDRSLGSPGSRAYLKAYAREQFHQRLRSGFGLGRELPSWIGLEVLELGCGHGGVSCFVAATGARRVVGVDLNVEHLGVARETAGELAEEMGRPPLPVSFEEMDAHALTLPPASFDLVLADNLFEHVLDPAQVLRGAFQVLRPQGLLVAPTFSSIRSKYGLHLKRGLRLPWANLLFSEATIVEAVQLRAERHPELLHTYPGAAHAPARVRDLRRYGDLNDLTHAEFLTLARGAGFEITGFGVHATLGGRLLRRLARLPETSGALELLSTAAWAVLRRPEA